MHTVSLRAYAKINLSLDVVGTRADGYHLLESVFQCVSLYDNVRVRREQGDGGIRIRCNLPYIPLDERNIVHKAATAFFRAAGISRYQVLIELHKIIPSGAGFGGGSSDGAAVFCALCALYKKSFTREEAIRILTPLGADIPFFFYSGTALVTGIGEKMAPIAPLENCCLVLAKPRAGISTGRIFERLEEVGFTRHPDTPGVVRAIEAGDWSALAAAAGNVLEPVSVPLCPRTGQLKDALKQNGALLALMSGSGSGVFGLFDDQKAARSAVAALRKITRQVYLTHPVSRPMKPSF